MLKAVTSLVELKAAHLDIYNTSLMMPLLTEPSSSPYPDSKCATHFSSNRHTTELKKHIEITDRPFD